MRPCLKLKHLELELDYSPALDVGHVPKILRSLHGLRDLLKVTITIVNHTKRWKEARETLTEAFMTPIEDALLSIRSLKTVELQLSRSGSHRYQRSYQVVVDEVAHLRFPRLYAGGMIKKLVG